MKMKDRNYWDKLLDTLSEGVEELAKGTNNLIENSKLKCEIHSIEGDIKKLFYDIGAGIYEDYKCGKTSIKEYEDIFRTIHTLEKKIQKLKNKLI
jgi:hypothetical protein